MIEKIKNIKFLVGIITSLLVALVTGIWFVFSTYQSFINKNEDLLDTIKTTQQMALKSVIWNEEIPLPERASACDVYLNAGYNSLTKKECESIIEKGAEQGIFSYVEKESETDEHSNNFSNDYGRNHSTLLYAY